jgi:hypothetical protein
MQITIKRIFSGLMLLGCAVTTYQLLSKPEPVAAPQDIEAARVNAASFAQKMQQLEAPRSGSASPEVHFSSDEIGAEVAESTGGLSQLRSASASQLSPDSYIAEGAVQVKGYQVMLDGDVARGQFVTQMAGKNIYVTLAGRLGSRDGYVTFDPTEFKIGDLQVPVSLVNSALQKKLIEQREQLKLPAGIASLRVENSELVITPK